MMPPSDAQTSDASIDGLARTPLPLGSEPDVAARITNTLHQLEQLQEQLDGIGGESLQSSRPPGDLALGYTVPADFLLSVIVPCYNEKDTICRVVGSLFCLPLPLEVIVVDDGSTDGTRDLLATLQKQYPQLQLILQPTNQGKGSALRQGFSAAIGDVVIVQDADLEYDPSDIPRLLEPLIKDQADVVFGSRFLESRHSGSSAVHRWGNQLLTGASNWMTGWRLTDMETCYKAFRRRFLIEMELEQEGFGFEVELTSKLARLGARVAERPISYHARSWAEGKKIGWLDAVNALYCIFRYR